MKKVICVIALIAVLGFSTKEFKDVSAKNKVYETNVSQVTEVQNQKADSLSRYSNAVSEFEAWREFDMPYKDLSTLSKLLMAVSGTDVKKVSPYDVDTSVIPPEEWTVGHDVDGLVFSMDIEDANKFFAIVTKLQVPVVECKVDNVNKTAELIVLSGEEEVG